MNIKDESVRTADPVSERLYAEVQQFYARQCHLLDSGDAEGWADTFTVDGAFALPSRPEPVRGRADLAAGARAAAAARSANGEVHRHVFSTIWVRPADSGSADGGILRVRSYTQVIVTPRGGEPALRQMCVCEDVLAREDGELRVRDRRVSNDRSDGFTSAPAG